VDEGGGNFTCDCDSGYVWNGISDRCEDDPCDPDPCGIDNAVAGTCVDEGGGDFTCDCDAGYVWDGTSDSCEDDPCDPDPCEGIQDATPDTCTAVASDDFTCDCDEGFEWNGGTNTCAEVPDPCDADPCATIPNTENNCQDAGGGDFTCDCALGYLWNDPTNTCAEVLDPCDADPCQGISNAVPDTCVAGVGDDFTCECDLDFAWEDASNTCRAEGVPAFAGGVYTMRMSNITQNPATCIMSGVTQNLIRNFARTIDLNLFLPSAATILALQDAGTPYPLTIDLPSPLTDVDVTLTLDPTWQDILMDGPDVYVADTAGVLPFSGVDCVITGSADGIFDDINTEPLTGTLTIDVTDVQASPGGACNLLWAPAGVCQLILTVDAGSPL
jgi:hypothetical protein